MAKKRTATRKPAAESGSITPYVIGGIVVVAAGLAATYALAPEVLGFPANAGLLPPAAGGAGGSGAPADTGNGKTGVFVAGGGFPIAQNTRSELVRQMQQAIIAQGGAPAQAILSASGGIADGAFGNGTAAALRALNIPIPVSEADWRRITGIAAPAGSTNTGAGAGTSTEAGAGTTTTASTGAGTTTTAATTTRPADYPAGGLSLSTTTRSNYVMEAQRALQRLGQDIGATGADGFLGTRTRTALESVGYSVPLVWEQYQALLRRAPATATNTTLTGLPAALVGKPVWSIMDTVVRTQDGRTINVQADMNLGFALGVQNGYVLFEDRNGTRAVADANALRFGA
jgi:peptidoglycan hydrolase-like protein with peptidoglycan-binding domain